MEHNLALFQDKMLHLTRFPRFSRETNTFITLVGDSALSNYNRLMLKVETTPLVRNLLGPMFNHEFGCAKSFRVTKDVAGQRLSFVSVHIYI